MVVREIESLTEFEQLRSAWEQVFADDPLASVFVSWIWLRGWFDVAPHGWTVLAVRDSASGAWVGFLGLSLRGSRHRLRFDHLREIHMAGQPGADYTGLVCRPHDRQRVIAALADHIARKLPWERIRFEEVNDPRIADLVARLPETNVVDREGIACPYIPLPATWDEYLEQTLTYETRKSLRKKMKAVERECRVVRLDGENAHAQIDALMNLAAARNREDQDPNQWRLHGPLRRCAEEGLAWLVMLWKGDQPVAGLGSLIDRKAGSMCTCVTSYNEGFAALSPGRVVNALTIRDAIEMGLKTLDFLRGPEAYKFQFGAQARHNRTIIVERRGLNTSIRRRISDLRDMLRL